jgi:inhibitor of nuclear factor kappa-B kinase subunit alpha
MDLKRATIEFFYSQKLEPSDIIKQLKGLDINPKQIKRVCKRLKEGRLADNRYLSGRSRTVRTPAMVKRVRERFRRNPVRSANKMAKQLHISIGTLNRIISEDLGLTPYKKRRAHGLSKAQEKKRLDRCPQLLERHADTDLEHLVFSDEKLFGTEEKLNSQNTRVYSLSIEDIPEHLRTVQRYQNEGRVMVWAAISKKGKFPLFFVENGVRITKEYYTENILESHLKVHGQSIYSNQPWTFQQDSAPAHKAKTTQDWCRANLTDFIPESLWPPSSPDLNPLDYSIWGILEARVNAKQHTSIESLKRTLIREWDRLPMKNVRAAIDSWPQRLRAVVKKKGGRFE